MAYTFGKYTFHTNGEYQAARRDARKIAGLSRSGRSTAEIARHYKQQIRDKQLTFESIVGEDFVAGLDKSLFLEPVSQRSTGTRTERVKKEHHLPRLRRFSAIKVGTIAAFIISFVIVAYALVVQVWTDFRSTEELQSLSRIADNAPAAGPQIVMATDPTGVVNESDTAASDESEEQAEVLPVRRVIMPRYQALYERNHDMAGWLRIPDTIIDYPVMYREDDNDYYLAHNFDGAEDVNGLLVLDKRCESDASGINNLIHGHNMDSGAIFGTLYLYRDYDYYEAHSKIQFDTLYEERTYEIIAVFVSSVYNSNANEFAYYDYINIESEEDFNEYVSTAKDLSLYDTGKTAVYGDELITLSTCEYSRANGRLVILGRRLR